MESMDIDATDQSLESSGNGIRPVVELVEEQSLESYDFDAPIEDTKNGSIGEETMVGKGVESQMGTTLQHESKSVMHDDHSSHNSVRSQSLGYGFEMGDMVWGKVKSHPWWPGHIFSEAFASSSVRRTKREGHVLVAFYGDSSYGWFDPAELIPYEPHYAEKSQQWTSRNFVKAVEESVDEACRRSALGMTCFCRNPYNFRPTNVPGHVAVDVFDFEAGGIYSDNQIRKVRDNFQPERTLLFIEQLAVAPHKASTSLDFVREKVTALAYRRAVFQEFDETYAQAFGQKSVRRIVAPPPSVDQSIQAQFSGPLVIAESLSSHRSSSKALKSKEQAKRYRSLFKQKNESADIGFSQIGQGHSSSSSSAASEVRPSHAAAGDYTLQRRDHAVDQQEDTTPAKDETAASRFSPSKDVAEAGKEVGYARPSMVQEQSDPPIAKSKKDGLLKGALKRSDTEKSDLGEKKKKKRRTESPGSSDYLPKHSSLGGPSAKGESPGRPIQIGASSLVDSQQEGISDNSAFEHEPAMSYVAAVPAEENMGELKRALADLKVLALNPFHGRERNRPKIARKIFLRFRSLVFQKSLAVLPSSTSGDKEASEIRSSKTPSRQTARTAPPSRPPKPSGRTDDPTKGGKKRVPSERQEDLAAKRAKRVSAVKSAAAASTEKTKAALETQHTDGKEKGHVAVPQRIGAKAGPGVKMQPPRARVEEPTFLVMKYPPGTSIPSSAELKARFARFGPMDTSQMRVFYNTSMCRILFLYKQDAESAHRFAVRNKSTYAHVRFTLRPHSVAPDSKAADKLGIDPSRVGEDESIDYVQPTPPMMMSSPAVQLKSCLKKPTDDEGGSQSSSGARGARVRFNVGETAGTGAAGGAQVKDPRTNSSSSSLLETHPGASFSVATDSHNNKKKVFSKLPLQPPLVPAPQFSPAPRNNPTHLEAPSRSHSQNYNYANMLPPPPPRNQALPPPPPRQAPPPPLAVDISLQMLSLLTRCNDVVTKMKSVLGYVPYHPL